MINLKFNYPSVQEEAELFRSFVQSGLNQDQLLKQSATWYEQELDILARTLNVPTDILRQSAKISACHSGNTALFNILFSLRNDRPLIGVEEFTYSGFKSVAGKLGLQMKGISCDEQGIVPSALEEAIGKGIKYLYLQPTIQNPSCCVMGEERRRTISYIIRKYNLTIIEDDAYRFLHHDPPPSFLKLIPENTIHIFSLSKPYNAFIKCCFIIRPNTILPGLEEILSDTGSFSATLSLLFAKFLLENNLLYRLAREKQKYARDVHASIKPLLEGLHYRSFPTAFHYWIKLPKGLSSIDCSKQLMAKQIMVAGAHEYSVCGNDGYIRIALSSEKDLAVLKKAVLAIKELLLSESA